MKNIAIYISAASVFISVISTLLVYITLREMKRQRLTTYLPIMAISSAEAFVVYGKDSFDRYSKSLRSINEFRGVKVNAGNQKMDVITMLLKNVGVGVARNVSYVFDRESVLNFMHIFDSSNNIVYSYSKSDNSIFIRDNDTSRGSWIRFRKESVAYLLANAVGEMKIRLPYEISDVLIYATRTNYIIKHGIPDLLIHITYEDIQGNRYSQILTLKFEVTVISPLESDEEGKVPALHFLLQIAYGKVSTHRIF